MFRSLKLHHTEATGACLVCSNVDRQGGPRGISPKPGPEVVLHPHPAKMASNYPATAVQCTPSNRNPSQNLSTPSKTPEQWREVGQQHSHPSIWCQLMQGSTQNHSSNLPALSAYPVPQQSMCSQTQRWHWENQSLPQHLSDPLGTCASLTQHPQSGGGHTAQP